MTEASDPSPSAIIDYGLLDQLVGYQLRRAHGAVFQDFTRALGVFELTPGLLGSMILIDTNSGMSQTALGQALGIDRSTVVPLVDWLEKRGLVNRVVRPADRRTHALELTAKGRDFLAKVKAITLEHEASMTRALSATERATLLDLLKRIYQT